MLKYQQDKVQLIILKIQIRMLLMLLLLQCIFFFIASVNSDLTASTLQYPITIGGYTGNTYIYQFAWDTSSNLVIAGCTQDSALVGPKSTYDCMLYVLYLTSGGQPYTWAKYFNNMNVTTVLSLEFSPDETQIVMTVSQSTNLFIVVMLKDSGSLILQLQQSSSAIELAIGAYARFQSGTINLACIGSDNGQHFLSLSQFDSTQDFSSPSIVDSRYSNGTEQYTGLSLAKGIQQDFLYFTATSKSSYIMSIDTATNKPNFIFVIQDLVELNGLDVYISGESDLALYGYLLPEGQNYENFYILQVGLSGSVDSLSSPITSCIQLQIGASSGNEFLYVDIKADSSTACYYIILNLVSNQLVLGHLDFQTGLITNTIIYSPTYYTPQMGMILDVTTSNIFVAYQHFSIAASPLYIGMLVQNNPLATNNIIITSPFSSSSGTINAIQCSSYTGPQCQTLIIYGTSLSSISWITSQLSLFQSTNPIVDDLIDAPQTQPPNCLIKATSTITQVKLLFYNQSLGNQYPTPQTFDVSSLIPNLGCTGLPCTIKSVFPLSYASQFDLKFSQSAMTITLTDSIIEKKTLALGCSSDQFNLSPKYSNCAYYYDCAYVQFSPPDIVMQTIKNMSYIVGTMPTSQTIPPYSNSWNITNDSNFTIVTLLQYNTSVPVQNDIITYNPSNQTITPTFMDITQLSLIGVYYLQINASFSNYNTGYTQSTQFLLTIDSPCANPDIITSFTPSNIGFTIGFDTIRQQPFTQWAYNNSLSCGAFVYTWWADTPLLTNTSSLLAINQTFITIQGPSGNITGTFNITLRGALVINGTEMSFKETNFLVYIYQSMSLTMIVGPMPPSQIYYVGYPMMTAILPNFTIPNNGLKVDMALFDLGNNPFWKSFLSFENSGNGYQLNLSTISYSDIQDLNIYINAWYDGFNQSFFFSAWFFQIRVLDSCGLVTANSSSIPTLQYIIGDGPKAFPPFADWTLSNCTNCNSIHYSLQGAPPFVSFNNSTKVVTIDTSKSSDVGIYNSTNIYGAIYSKNGGQCLSQKSPNFNIQIISNIGLNITSPGIGNDTVFTVASLTPSVLNFSQFNNSQPSLNISYQLYSAIPTDPYLSLTYSETQYPYDASLFSFNPTTLAVSVWTNDTSKVGTYYLKIRGYYTIAESYYQDQPFQIEVNNICIYNVITPPMNVMAETQTEAIATAQLNRYEYQIGSGQSTFQIAPWIMNISNPICQYIQYSAAMTNGLIMPPYIQFGANMLQVKIDASSIYIVGTLWLTINATARFHQQQLSIISWNYPIFFVCLTQQIVAQVDSGISVNFILGKTIQEIVPFQDFQRIPPCKEQQEPITYSAMTILQTPLPSFIVFNSEYKNITITDNGKMPANSVIKIKITGTTRSVISDFFVLQLTISQQLKPPPVTSFAVQSLQQAIGTDYITLNTISITVEFGTKQTFQSQDFAQFTNGSYQLLVVDIYMTFVTQQGQTISFSPLVEDIGPHYVFMVCKQGTLSLVQQININVTAPKISKNKLQQLLPLGFSIQSISKIGVVTLKFNQDIQVPQNATSINQRNLMLQMKNTQLLTNINSWSSISITSQTMTIKIVFQDPLKVSQNVYNFLKLTSIGI